MRMGGESGGIGSRGPVEGKAGEGGGGVSPAGWGRTLVWERRIEGCDHREV